MCVCVCVRCDDGLCEPQPVGAQDVVSGGASQRVSARHDPVSLRLAARKHLEVRKSSSGIPAGALSRFSRFIHPRALHSHGSEPHPNRIRIKYKGLFQNRTENKPKTDGCGRGAFRVCVCMCVCLFFI